MGKHAPTIFSHTNRNFKDNYDAIFGKKDKPKAPDVKQAAPKKKEVKAESPIPVSKRKKSMQESMVAERAVAEKVNTTLRVGRVGKPEKLDMNKLTEEQQRQVIFETWPGDELGLTTGKMHHDAYDAIKPVPDSTQK